MAGTAVLDSPAPWTIAFDNDTTLVRPERRNSGALEPMPQGGLVAYQADAMIPAVPEYSISRATPGAGLGLRSVHGRVIIAEPAYTEHADRDLCKIVTRILWILLLLASPILILYYLAVKVGGLPALIAFAGLFLMARFASPTSLYAMFRIFSVLNPAARDSKVLVSVRYFRIREHGTDSEVMVRMKGTLNMGNLGLEDLVTLTGRFRQGTLHAQAGYNHRTASTIRLARSFSWVGLILTLAIIIALVAVFYEPTTQLARTINSFVGEP